MFVDDAVQDEFRSQSIMPLALGSDSGRRMGATQAVRKLAAAPERPRVQLVATLAKGDSFQRMLQRAGVGKSDAARVAELVEDGKLIEARGWSRLHKDLEAIAKIDDHAVRYYRSMANDPKRQHKLPSTPPLRPMEED